MPVPVRFKKVEKMLEDCAPGSTVRVATHVRMLEYNGKVVRRIPKHKEVHVGHIRHAVRHLGIDQECADRHIPALKD